MNPVSVEISIIVATFNRSASLQRLLRSLDQLEYLDGAAVEVLIIDNGSTDGTARLLKEEQAKSRKFVFRTFYEAQRGQSAAINCGLRNCHGQIICLLDDDVVVDSSWLKGILESYKTSPFDALQGRVLPGVDPFGKTADSKELPYYNILVVDHGSQTRAIRGLTGAHMTFKRAVFDKVGFFDVRLGPGSSGFSGDSEYSRRIRGAGFTIGYTPHAVVFHELDPNRYGRGYNRRVEYRKGWSRSLYRHDSIAFRVIPNLLANCLRYLLYCLLGRTQKAYKTEGRIMKCWGYLMGKMHGVKSVDRHSQV
jgi:glycosyltransferase involved in cell wall biosynthesis